MAAPRQRTGSRKTVGLKAWFLIGAAIFSSLSSSRAEFVNPETRDSQAALEAVAFVGADSGQAAIAAASPGDTISTATELDAIRLEIIMLRRFTVILGGIFFGWAILVKVFSSH
jgi:hypothetical protein